jgi:hypothetical protein
MGSARETEFEIRLNIAGQGLVPCDPTDWEGNLSRICAELHKIAECVCVGAYVLKTRFILGSRTLDCHNEEHVKQCREFEAKVAETIERFIKR